MKILLLVFATVVSLLPHHIHAEQPSAPSIADEFLVLAFLAPPPEQANVERYREIVNAGIDVIVPSMGTADIESHKQALDLAEQVGLRVLVPDLRILPRYEVNRKHIDQSQIDAVTVDYRNHPALLGYLTCDEPNTNYFEELASTSRRLYQADPEHSAYINLFPGYANSKQLGCDNFREYVHRFVQTVKPRVLSYDHYPFLKSMRDNTGWYDDLRVIRDESRQANIPFWICLQSEGIKDYLRIPTRAEVFWQVSTVLAYGTRGVVWFTYWTPPPIQNLSADNSAEHQPIEKHVGGMISYDGQRTPVYDAVREANQFLRKAGSELFGWDNRHIAHYQDGTLEDGSQSPCITPVGTDTKLVVGTFVQGNRRRVVIANDSYSKEAAFTIEPKDSWQPSSVIAAQEANQKSSDDDLSQWELGPGGCLLLECQQSATWDR